MTYSHDALAVACQDYLRLPSDLTRNRFYKLAFGFAYEQACFHLKFHSSRLWARDYLVDDLASYSLEKLMLEFAKPRFHAQSWLENTPGCLKTFFKHRAISFFRHEGNYQFKYANGEYFDTDEKDHA